MRALIERIGYVPKVCVWEITRRCDLRCAHCGTGAGHRREGELSREACVDVARQLAAMGTRLITLSGGEPTLRSDWPTIARAAVEAGVTVNMVTNGQTDDPQALAREAKEAGLSNIGISLDGAEATHDSIRRRGAFEKATRTVKTLATTGGVWVDVMYTVNRLNLPELPKVYQMAHQLGARGFRVQLGKPMGNQTYRDDLTLRQEDMLTLLPMLGRLSKRGPLRVDVGDSVGYFSPQEKLLRGHRCSMGHWTGCYAGCQSIGIQSDGTVKGCLSLQPREGEEDPYIEGSLQESSLESIWLRPGAFAYNREFSRESLGGYCASCSYAELCRGGASCVSHAFTGKTGRDPLCYHAATMVRAGARRAIWVKTASAAAAAMLLGLSAGCSSHVRPEGNDLDAGTDADTVEDASTVTDATPDTDVRSDAAVDADVTADADEVVDADARDCSEVECECFVCDDYGMSAPCEPCAGEEAYTECCCEYVDCSEPCLDCDYGIPPRPEAQALCCEPAITPDYGDPDPWP